LGVTRDVNSPRTARTAQPSRRGTQDVAREIYAWFTVGDGTGDLIEAKALLEELNSL
jgi:hypothetical protein